MANKNDDANIELTSGLAKLPKPREIKVSAAKVIVDPLNFRFDGTNNELELDTTSLAELEMQVRADGQINKHICLFDDDRPDGMLTAGTGGRRLRVAKKILADVNASVALHKAMNEIPAYVYKNLTDEQKLYIINDQDQKKFRFTELVKLTFIMFEKGLTWYEVGARVYRQWGDATGKADILNELDALAGDQRAWMARLKKWLRGTMDEVYGAAYRLGGKVMNTVLTEAAEKDKLILTLANAPKGTPSEKIKPGPYVKLMGKQDRFAELEKAKAADQANNEWSEFEWGPAFRTSWEKFHKEDVDGKGPPPPKSLSREKILELTKVTRSAFGVKVLKTCAGDTGIEWKNDDANTALFEAKMLKYLQNAGNFLDDNIKKALYMAFVVDDFEKFKEWLKSVCKPEVVVTPPAPAEQPAPAA